MHLILSCCTLLTLCAIHSLRRPKSVVKISLQRMAASVSKPTLAGFVYFLQIDYNCEHPPVSSLEKAYLHSCGQSKNTRVAANKPPVFKCYGTQSADASVPGGIEVASAPLIFSASFRSG